MLPTGPLRHSEPSHYSKPIHYSKPDIIANVFFIAEVDRWPSSPQPVNGVAVKPGLANLTVELHAVALPSLLRQEEHPHRTHIKASDVYYTTFFL